MLHIFRLASDILDDFFFFIFFLFFNLKFKINCVYPSYKTSGFHQCDLKIIIETLLIHLNQSTKSVDVVLV